MEKDHNTAFGLFVKKNFIDRELCERIRMEMLSAKGLPAYFVVNKENKPLVNENVRRAVEKEVSNEIHVMVRDKLSGVKEELAAYFDITLSHLQEPRFLSYGEGDFFQIHTDKSTNPQHPQRIRDRKITTIIFLNDETDVPENNAYTGGSFIIYGILNIPRFESHGFKVSGTTGMLIAFRSELLHEVTPITSGVRYTVADWFV